jgi:hypothetical protein
MINESLALAGEPADDDASDALERGEKMDELGDEAVLMSSDEKDEVEENEESLEPRCR